MPAGGRPHEDGATREIPHEFFTSLLDGFVSVILAIHLNRLSVAALTLGCKKTKHQLAGVRRLQFFRPEATVNSNLVQHRSDASVWDHVDQEHAHWDMERYLAAMTAGACLVIGFRRRSLTGLMLAAGGSALAWWAASGVDLRRHHRGRLKIGRAHV